MKGIKPYPNIRQHAGHSRQQILDHKDGKNLSDTRISKKAMKLLALSISDN